MCKEEGVKECGKSGKKPEATWAEGWIRGWDKACPMMINVDGIKVEVGISAQIGLCGVDDIRISL